MTHGPTVEVAHEALIRTWERFREWVAVSRDDLRIQRRLSQATAEWLESERDPGFLAREARLVQFEAWATHTDLALNPDERAYLDASIADRVQREETDRERKAYEMRIARRAQTFLRASVMLGVMVVLALIAMVSAILTTRDAQATQATVEARATSFFLVQDRQATLAAGGVILPAPRSTYVPEEFVATLTQIAELNNWEPVIQEFDGVEMVLVPPGCFMMGSIFYDNEQPIHVQCFDLSFWIDRYEVTRMLYAECVAAGACDTSETQEDNYYSARDTQPAIYISWFMARDFCEWRSARLPTEVEGNMLYAGRKVWFFPGAITSCQIMWCMRPMPVTKLQILAVVPVGFPGSARRI